MQEKAELPTTISDEGLGKYRRNVYNRVRDLRCPVGWDVDDSVSAAMLFLETERTAHTLSADDTWRMCQRHIRAEVVRAIIAYNQKAAGISFTDYYARMDDDLSNSVPDSSALISYRKAKSSDVVNGAFLNEQVGKFLCTFEDVWGMLPLHVQFLSICEETYRCFKAAAEMAGLTESRMSQVRADLSKYFALAYHHHSWLLCEPSNESQIRAHCARAADFYHQEHSWKNVVAEKAGNLGGSYPVFFLAQQLPEVAVKRGRTSSLFSFLVHAMYLFEDVDFKGFGHALHSAYFSNHPGIPEGERNNTLEFCFGMEKYVSV